MITTTLRHALLICLSVSLLTPHGFSSTLSISANIETTGGTIGVNQVLNPALSTDILVSTQTISSTYSAGNYYVRAGFGNLGVSGYANGICNNYPSCNQVGGGGPVSAGSVDAIFVKGANAADFLTLKVHVDGSADAEAFAQDYTYPGAGAFYLLNAPGLPQYEIAGGCTTQGYSCGDNITNVSSTVLIPLSIYDSTSVYTILTQSLRGDFSCGAVPGFPCSASIDFAHTAAVGGASVVDAQGNLVAGATITSGSGYDYTQSLSAPASPAPEPASLALLVTAMPVLFLLGRKKKALVGPVAHICPPYVRASHIHI